MSELEYLDATGYGSFSGDDVLNPHYFVQEDTQSISRYHQYELTEEHEAGWPPFVGHVTRHGKRYNISFSW